MWEVSVDLREFHRDVEQTRRALPRILGTSVTAAAKAGAEAARRQGRFKDRTGDLRRSIDVRGRIANGSVFEVDIVAPLFYSSFVEEGTQPHDIRPKFSGIGAPRPGQSRRARNDVGTHRIALRWYVGGRPVFARVVHHPGSRPYPFMGPAYYEAERSLYRELDRGFVTVERIWS